MHWKGLGDPFLLSFWAIISLRWTPHPVIVTIRDNRDYIRVLLYSYYTTITGWGVLLTYHLVWSSCTFEDLLMIFCLFGL